MFAVNHRTYNPPVKPAVWPFQRHYHKQHGVRNKAVKGIKAGTIKVNKIPG